MNRQGGVAIALWLLLVLACGLIAKNSKYTADLSAFLPSHPTATQQLFIDQLKTGVASRLVLVGLQNASTEALATLSQDLARRLRASNEFVVVKNGETEGAERDREFVFSHRYLLSPTVNPQRFTVDGLHAAIAESIDLLASPAGLMMKPLLTRDPTGETLQLLDSINNDAGPRRFDGIWVSHDGKRAILLAQTLAAGSDTDGQQQAITAIQQAFDQAIKERGMPAAQMVITGPGVFSVTSRSTIQEEVTRLSIVSTLVVTLLLFLIYRSFTAVLLGTLPVATGILVGIAAVSLGFGMVHGVTLGFGITLIGEAVDYSIYLFIQSERRNGQERAQNWLSTFWPTIRLGVLTSIIGFASLLFSGFPGLAQLGLYSVAGLIAAATVTRFILPTLLPRTFQIRDVSRFGGVLAEVSRRAIALRWITGVLVLVAVFVIYGQRNSLWNNDLSALSPISAADRALDVTLRHELGAPDPRYIVVASGNSMQAAISASEKIAAKLDTLVEDGTLAGYDSPGHYLPSIAVQNARLAAIPDATELATRLQAGLAGLPLRAERLTAFLQDMEAARNSKPLERSDLTGTSMALAVDALLVNHGDRWSALLPLRAPAGATIDAMHIRQALADAGQADALFVDAKAELDLMYGGYLSDALKLSLAGLAAILGVILIALRSPTRMVRIVLPLAIAVVLVIAGLLLGDHRLTILHLIGLLLIVAIGSNYALFFDQKSHDAADINYSRTLASLLFANVTTVAVFGLLAFSSVPVLKNIGMTVAPGVVLALLLSAILARRRAAGESAKASQDLTTNA